MEPRLYEPLYNAVLGITNDILQPGQSYRKMYGTEPRSGAPNEKKIGKKGLECNFLLSRILLWPFNGICLRANTI